MRSLFDWLGPVSFFFTLVGLWVGYRYRSTKRISWHCTNCLIIKDAQALIDGLEVVLSGERVGTISIATVSILNVGTVPLRSSDVSLIAPLRICARNGARLRRVQLIRQRTLANNFEGLPTIHEDSAVLRFDYVNRHDGAYYQIVHTGTSADDIFCEGTLIGFKLKKAPSADVIAITEYLLQTMPKNLVQTASALAVAIVLFGMQYPILGWYAIVGSLIALGGICILGTRYLKRRFSRSLQDWAEVSSQDSPARPK